MIALIILVILAITALVVVRAIKLQEEKERDRRLNQRKIKVQADFLTEVINSVEPLTPTKLIIKLLNDEIIKLLKGISALDKIPQPYLVSSIERAQARSDELASDDSQNKTNYMKENATQIKYAQLQLKEAIRALHRIHQKNIITDAELEAFEKELLWSHLMVSVMSYIGQGQEFILLDDQTTAQNYFKKAQELLTQSTHADPRRVKMIDELTDMIEGTRDVISEHLLN